MYNEENNKNLNDESESITPYSTISNLDEYEPKKGDPIDAYKLSMYIQRKLYLLF